VEDTANRRRRRMQIHYGPVTNKLQEFCSGKCQVIVIKSNFVDKFGADLYNCTNGANIKP
jgi:hypothetical protein